MLSRRGLTYTRHAGDAYDVDNIRAHVYLDVRTRRSRRGIMQLERGVLPFKRNSRLSRRTCDVHLPFRK